MAKVKVATPETSEKVEKVEVTIEEYNGKPIFTINPKSRFPFRFGLAKAQLILDTLPKIEQFVNTNKEVK